MNRRLTQTIILMLILITPALAWAGGAACADGVDGSDSGRFQQLLEQHGVIVAVLGCFAAGVLASLTPCVYPMVPITVSIFGATESTSRSRGAALSGAFVLGIATLFTPMGVVSALSGKLMGSALSNAYVAIALALLFFALAASMFGAFELALPASITNKLSTVGGVGFKGAFVMGLVMGLIAAPCTGPFLTGIVTVIATTKNVALGAASLFAFSLGLGVIFFVAGATAVNLPKAGAWMMGIKWISGVLLAYVGFAQLRDKFAGVRALIDHPSPAFGFAAIALLVVGLVLGGLHIAAERRKSPLAHLSKTFKLASILPAIVGMALLFSRPPSGSDEPMAGDTPAIKWLTNEEEALSKAKAEGKPVLIDFGAEWCAACKKLEHQTFPDPNVRSEAARFVALRVDATDDEDPNITRLKDKYKVVGLPTVIVLDKSGKEVVRFNDFVKPDQFYTTLKCKVRANEAVGML